MQQLYRVEGITHRCTLLLKDKIVINDVIIAFNIFEIATYPSNTVH